jgi:hypothetical protein
MQYGGGETLRLLVGVRIRLSAGQGRAGYDAVWSEVIVGVDPDAANRGGA